MKTRIIILLLSLITISLSCNNDDDANNQALDLVGKWHVISITGGIGGVNQTLERDELVWIFTETDLTIIDSMIGSTGDPITRPYDIIEVQGLKYLTINDQDFGEIVLSNGILGIDTNKHSNSSGNDGFGYTLER